jgi:hypothetical protein
MFRSYDHLQAENILLARITQLTTDPLFYTIANIRVIVFYDQLRQLIWLLLWATFLLRCIISIDRYLRGSNCQFSVAVNLGF